MTLSSQAWRKSARVIQAIKCHPFNQELMHGILLRHKFIHYLKQDILFLKALAKYRNDLASRLPSEQRSILSKDTTLDAEEATLHYHFVDPSVTALISSATSSYLRHLSCTCKSESVELGISAVLPCYWIYRELGLYMAQHADLNKHPYTRWIETYTSDKVDAATNNMIRLFDTLAEKVSDATRQKMLDKFHKSTCLEWHFWNDAYQWQLASVDCICDSTSEMTTASAVRAWSAVNNDANEVVVVGSAGLEPATTPL